MIVMCLLYVLYTIRSYDELTLYVSGNVFTCNYTLFFNDNQHNLWQIKLFAVKNSTKKENEEKIRNYNKL